MQSNGQYFLIIFKNMVAKRSRKRSHSHVKRRKRTYKKRKGAVRRHQKGSFPPPNIYINAMKTRNRRRR